MGGGRGGCPWNRGSVENSGEKDRMSMAGPRKRKKTPNHGI